MPPYHPPTPVMGPDFLTEFIKGFGLAQSRQRQLQDAEAFRRDMENDQLDRQMRAEHLAITKKELEAKMKRQELDDKMAMLDRQTKANQLQAQLSQIAPPTAAEQGIPEQGPEFGGPSASQINVAQPTMDLGGVAMPVPNARQELDLSRLVAEQAARKQAEEDQSKLQLHRGMREIDLQTRPPEKAEKPVFEKALDTSTGKLVFVTPYQIQNGNGRYVPAPAGNANGEGGKPLLSGEISNIRELRSGLATIDRLAGEVGQTGAGSKAGTMIPDAVTEYTGWGADSKSRQAVLDQARQVIGKAMEGGVLRKEDEAKYLRILPTIGDPPEVAKSKLANLRTVMEADAEIYLQTLEDAGRDVKKTRERMGSPTTTQNNDPLGIR